MFNIGASELVVILLVAFVIVGPKDLPRIARWLGRAVRSLRGMFDDLKEDTGLGEAMDEFKQTRDDLNKTVKEIDPTKELREAQSEAAKSVNEAQKSVKDGLGKKDTK